MTDIYQYELVNDKQQFPTSHQYELVYVKQQFPTSQRTTDGKLEIVVYRKPTHTDKYLSFNSHYPRSHNRAVVTTLFQRAENLTSNNDARENECQYVTNILKENNFII